MNTLKRNFLMRLRAANAGFSSAKRVKNEQTFLSGDKSIMVATTAFGMGIDLGAIDLVIHFNMPLSLTDYMQQTGRAGRDGQKAHCVLLYDDEDYHINQAILSDSGSTRARKQLDQRERVLRRYKALHVPTAARALWSNYEKELQSLYDLSEKFRRNNT